MGDSRLPRNSAAIKYALQRVLEGVTLTQGDQAEIVQFMNVELPRFEQANDTYLVLGSYRGDYGIRLRKFAHRLALPSKAASIVLGDTIDLDTDLEFDIKLNLLGAAADHITGVYEKESGGETPELGFIRALFAYKTYVFPRDYIGLTRDAFDTRSDVVSAAIEIYFADDLSDNDKREELLRLLGEAHEEGIEIGEAELVEILQARIDEIGEGRAGYNWVLLSYFRRFERAEQCYPWVTLQELLENAAKVPQQEQPRWADPYRPEDLFSFENEPN